MPLGSSSGRRCSRLGTRRIPRKAVLLALMAIFTIGNAACALAPSYGWLMAARVLTSLAHGTFFGVGSVVATRLVAQNKRASAISTHVSSASPSPPCSGCRRGVACLLLGWRAAFWTVAAIGVIAFAILAVFVPGNVGRDDKPTSLREEVAVLARPQVLLGLAITVFGFGGLFTVFTYIQPILTRITGFSQSAVSPILLVLGAGLAIGNVMGGRFADRGLARALIGTLAGLAIVLVALAPVLEMETPTVLLMGLLGVAAFSTVAPASASRARKSRKAPDRTSPPVSTSRRSILAMRSAHGLGASRSMPGLGLQHCSWSLPRSR